MSVKAVKLRVETVRARASFNSGVVPVTAELKCVQETRIGAWTQPNREKCSSRISVEA